MSFKKISCLAALAALTASPAFAVPAITFVNNGLDSNGDWVWEMFLDSDELGAEGVELGLQFSDANYVSHNVVTTGAGMGGLETDNPGQEIFGFETIAGTDGGPAGTQVSGNNVFYSYGLGTTGIELVSLGTFTTEGPSTNGSLTTSVSIIGAYDSLGDYVGSLSTHGLIAQDDAGTPVYTGVNPSASRTAYEGDANLMVRSTS